MKAMLFAAGLGTRLKPFTDNCPKALVRVNDKSLLEHNIRYLQSFGIYDVVINVHHFASMIEEEVIANKGFGSNITISDESDMVLETGGGLKKASPYLIDSEPIVVMNVDVFTDLNLEGLINAHKNDTAIATLAVMKRSSSRYFLFDNDMKLCGWMNDKTGEMRMSQEVSTTTPYAFSGLQVLSQDVFRDIPFAGKFSLVDLYLYLAETKLIRGYDHTGGLFIDVGKPDSLALAAGIFK